MSNTISRAIGIALGTAAFAVATGQGLGAAQSQTPQSQTPSAPPSVQSSRSSADQSVTVTGCIQREADFRRASGAGRGGAVGTGIGAGNEFILANATMSASTSGAAAPTSGANTPSPTGTAGTRSATAYELTGSKEGDAGAFVGKRVEITGMVKPMSSTGGPTANAPLSQDLKLSELEISSIRETTGACAASTSPTP
jgi:hypothetical protein